MNYKNLHFFCFNYANFDYTTSIIIIILFNLSLLQISFSIEQINNNQIGNVTEKEIKKVVDQDILYSKSVNNKTNIVVILPSTNNDTIYNGIITYSSNQPVYIGIQHNINNNSSKVNSSAIIENKKFFTSMIYPDYIVKEKIYSSSLPFVGSALTFNYEKPFFVIYSIIATIEKYEKNTNSQNSLISDTQSIKNQQIDPFGPPTAYPTNGLSSTKLLKEVLPYLSIEILSQLPLDQLPNKECNEILEKLSIEERNKITCKKEY
ncbi:MAG TPA: hypothetical protein VF222_12945 [Nitrososphaeraceae archaeon]